MQQMSERPANANVSKEFDSANELLTNSFNPKSHGHVKNRPRKNQSLVVQGVVNESAPCSSTSFKRPIAVNKHRCVRNLKSNHTRYHRLGNHFQVIANLSCFNSRHPSAINPVLQSIGAKFELMSTDKTSSKVHQARTKESLWIGTCLYASLILTHLPHQLGFDSIA